VRTGRLFWVVRREVIEAHPEIKGQTPPDRPRILQVETRVVEVVLLLGRRVVCNHLERRDMRCIRAVIDRVNPLVYLVNVWVERLTRFKSELEVVSSG